MDFRAITTHAATQGSGIDATTNSNAISIGRTKAISVQFIGAAFDSGNGSGSVSLDVSNDGYNWTDYNLFDNISGTIVVSKNIASTGSIVLVSDWRPAFQYARTSLLCNIDGSYTVILGVQE